MNPVLEKKYRALEDFIDRVKRADVSHHILKMILYGSVLHGRATPESDIDLLVIATGDMRAVEQAISDIAFEVMLDKGELVSPMVYCPDEYRYPHYFVRSVKDSGKEVYSVTDEEARYKEAMDILHLAESFLAMARGLQGPLENIRGVIDLGYNAAELCAKALLLVRGEELPKSHGAIVQQFSRVFIVEQKAIDPALGRAFHRSLERRNRARYDAHAILTEKDAQETISLAEELVQTLTKVIMTPKSS